MNSAPSRHLDAEQIAAAVVDSGDLSGAQQRHLQDCPRCSAEKQRLEQGLDALGREARRLAPRPAVRIQLPEKVPGTRFSALRWLAPALALAAAAVLALAVWPPAHFRPASTTGLRQAAVPTGGRDAFLARIDALVRDATPAEYVEITGLDETQDDDLTDFIVPSVATETPMSCLTPHTGGMHPC